MSRIRKKMKRPLMSEYTSMFVENLLRNYYTLQQHPDSTFSSYKIDLENSLKTLKRQNKVLYFTVVNVFTNGMPIQTLAYNEGVSTRQVNRRLHDGLHTLTMIMNGEIL